MDIETLLGTQLSGVTDPSCTDNRLPDLVVNSRGNQRFRQTITAPKAQ